MPAAAPLLPGPPPPAAPGALAAARPRPLGQAEQRPPEEGEDHPAARLSERLEPQVRVKDQGFQPVPRSRGCRGRQDGRQPAAAA